MLHLVGFLLTLNYDARNQELKIHKNSICTLSILPSGFFFKSSFDFYTGTFESAISCIISTVLPYYFL